MLKRKTKEEKCAVYRRKHHRAQDNNNKIIMMKERSTCSCKGVFHNEPCRINKKHTTIHLNKKKEKRRCKRSRVLFSQFSPFFFSIENVYQFTARAGAGAGIFVTSGAMPWLISYARLMRLKSPCTFDEVKSFSGCPSGRFMLSNASTAAS